MTDSIIKMLQDGVAPWQKPWDPTLAGAAALPFNPTSNNAYRGGNALQLMASAMTEGLRRPTLDDVQASRRERLAGAERRKGNAN